jgi:glutathione S-transferase
MAEKPTFGYWGVRGRGASIRLLLAHLSVDYENIAYSDPEVWFGTDKPALQTAFPNLPYWKDGDVVMSETLAILAQICRKYKPDYLGRTLKEQAETSMVMGAADAAQMKFAKVLFGEGDFEAGKAA